MGLFSSKKEIYTSSVTYPLGDDSPDRVSFLKGTVLNAVLQGRNIGESIPRAYLHGQGLRLRSAYRYARDKYHLGLPRSGYLYNDTPNRDELVDLLESFHPGKEISLIQVVVTLAEYTWWAERYLAEMYGYDRRLKEFSHPPAGVDPLATVSYDKAVDGTISILLTNPDATSHLLTFRPDENLTGLYVHAAYRLIDTFPTETTTTTRPFEVGDADDVDTVVTVLSVTNEWIETTVRTEMTVLGEMTKIQVKKTVRVLSRNKYFMYALGSGSYPTLDAWKNEVDEVDSPYFPTIPLRLDNRDVSFYLGGEANWHNHPLYKTSKRMLQKVGIKYDEMVEKMKDNEQIGEIDFAYLMFGVSLNTASPEGKKYLYRFFDLMSTQSQHTKADFEEWQTGGGGTPMDPGNAGGHIPQDIA